MKKKLFLFVIFSFLLISIPQMSLSAQEPFKIPKLSQAPKIDGVLDNLLWEQEALKIEDFVQYTPKENGAPSEKTVAYIGYNRKNLYIAFRSFEKDPKKIRATITNRDNIIDDDWVAVFLDAYNEKRRAFTFIINPLGVQMDLIRTEEGGNEMMDESWDTAFFSDGKIDDQGYTVEMAIPFKSIRFPDKEEKIWGLLLARNIARNGEIVSWPVISKSIPGLLCQECEINIQGEVEKGKNFELMPIFTSLKKKEEDIDYQPGMNFKWGISSDITMDLTVNPDFSHIEADAPQIDINRRYALYYPEKRPFFLEGMEIFQFPQIEMVYTRRIIEPLGGAKLTGKVGRFTYGLLSAYDTSPTESLWEVHNGGVSGDDNALFNVFRMKTDVFKESYVGFCLADKEIDGSYNRVVGVDGQLKFNNRFFLSFQAIGSKTKYDEEETDIAPAVYADFSYFSKNWTGGLYWMS
ncbi:MAG: carbohydrate binding family 9 domain-containing protein, partial [Candidatus Aminicenantes bacterium]|nr:carbohydrate binding family 9 domain-containing protein [Candidatus Aminicenantes bacterium]